MKNAIVALALIACMSACTKKLIAPSQTESVRYVEREVVRNLIDTVTVLVEVPAQSSMSVTADTISYLETDYAESSAMWSGGLLTHTLNNKVVPIAKQVNVPRIEKEKHIELTDTITISVPYEVPVPLGRWAKFKIDAFWWLLGGCAGMLAILFRSPLLKLIRRLIRF